VHCRLVPLMVLAMVLTGGSCGAFAQAEEREYEPDVILVIKEKAFHMVKGNASGQHSEHPAFSLSSGEEITLELRNEDTLPHEFVSPMLFNVPFALDGNGVFVKLPNAAGVRVDPGRVVRLTFDVPQDSKEFQNMYEVFWCNVHGKQHGDKMRGEVLVVDHRGEIGGG